MILDVAIKQLVELRDRYGGHYELRVAPTDGVSTPTTNYRSTEAFLFAGRDWEEPYVCLEYDPNTDRFGISNDDRMKDFFLYMD